jgi:RimJ/RimL family protein N-acetyltransferase
MPHLVHLLGPADRDALHEHFAQLSNHDLRLRFGHVPDPGRLRRYVDDLDFGRDTVFGVRSDERLAGVTHVALFDGAAELGLSVLPGYRGQGVAAAMFDRSVLHARNRGVVELFMHCLSENQAMRKLARRAGMRILVEGTETDAWVELPPGNPFTVGQELAAQQLALVDETLRVQLALARSLATLEN